MTEAPENLPVTGLSHLIVEVDDVAQAAFYRDTLGFADAGTDMVAGCGRSVALTAAQGGLLVLAERKARPELSNTGVHQAYGVGTAARDRIGEKLAAQGIAVATYHEDRPAEYEDNFYFADPAGNRVQLVTSGTANGGAPSLDHAGVQVANIWWSERFYMQALACEVEHRVGWKTEDYARAQLWADGKEDMAPGTRRKDKRYSSMANRREVPRVNMQIYFRVGAAPFAVYLANRHFQEPPEEDLVGTPRTAFAVPETALDAICRRLEAAHWPFAGPVRHDGGPVTASVYFKDPGGNFLEFAARAS